MNVVAAWRNGEEIGPSALETADQMRVLALSQVVR